MKPLWNWCEPSVGEMDLARVLGSDTARSGILCWAADRPVVVEKIHHSDRWFDRTHRS